MKSTQGPNGSPSGREQALTTCSQLPASELTYPFGEATAVFKVIGRMFAVVSLSDEPDRITLKCDPDYGAALCGQFAEIAPGYHMNKRHWITIVLDPTLPTTLTDELIIDSYDLVLAGLPAHLRPSPNTSGR